MKATVIVADENHYFEIMDVVKYENGFWLVPYWLDNREQKVSRPERIISLATLPHQFGKGSPEITVNDPVPKYFF